MNENLNSSRDVVVAITAASYSGNKGAAAMLQSAISQLNEIYGSRLNINLMSVYPSEDKKQLPFDFIKVISAKPEQILFIAFPLAILYNLFKWCSPIRKLIEKNKIIKAYKNTDVVLDQAGISFVDSRGFVMNTYAFVTMAIPLLVGTDIVKYSQAMGTFKSFINRTLAKIILPKIKLICARGQVTYDNLKEIGITENVKLCADGAFSMADSPKHDKMVEEQCSKDKFYESTNIVGLSISSVVEKKCEKIGIPYKEVMVQFIDNLNNRGYEVLIIANAARINSDKPRNNDLMICESVFKEVKNKDMVRWYYKEMEAEEIRAYLARCRFLVASRFHTMIGALEKKVPVLLVGWSHKYQEVLDMFKLGEYAIDFSKLEVSGLLKEFDRFVENESNIRKLIDENYDEVIESSRNSIRYTIKIIDEIQKKTKKKITLHDYQTPERYIGQYIACRKGYAKSVEIRKNAASGGMITAFLSHLLETKQIDGAWVTKSEIINGKLSYNSFIATTSEELRNSSSSIYMDMPLLSHLDIVRNFDGKVAVVLTPCLLRNLTLIMEKEESLKEKIILKLGLYCSGNHSDKATLLSLEKANVSIENAKRLYYRRGHWRGISTVIYKDGSEKKFSYTKTICAYKNAYFFEKSSCMTCQDHYGAFSDLSFGDIWLKEMKNEEVKHTSCVIRNKKAFDMYESAIKAGAIIDSHISGKDIVRSQKRALVFKFNCALAKKEHYSRADINIKIDTNDKCKWNHRLAYYLARKNEKYSKENYESMKKIPMIVIYYYMCFIRVLLSF